MTQEAVASATGLPPAAISHYECGRRSPNLEHLALLCKALRIDRMAPAAVAGYVLGL